MVETAEKSPKNEVWDENSIKREELRGLFVFGILAFIFAAYQTHELGKIFASQPPFVLPLGRTLAGLLVFFWGGYVLLTAVSMLSFDSKNSWTVGSMRITKLLGETAFQAGSLFVVMFTVILGVLLSIQEYDQNPVKYFETLLIPIVTVVVVLPIAYYLKKHDKSKDN